MNKFVKISILICIVLLALIIFRYTQEEFTPSEQEIAAVRNASTLTAPELAEVIDDEDAISIAVRGIILTQGESGEETWRLNATSASFDQESGKLTINQPRVTYYLRSQNSELLIQSRIGRLNQAENEVEMWDDVRVDESDNILTTSKAIYNGNNNVITLPEPLDFFNPQFLGSANEANWDLATNVLSAIGNVRVTIISDKD